MTGYRLHGRDRLQDVEASTDAAAATATTVGYTRPAACRSRREPDVAAAVAHSRKQRWPPCRLKRALAHPFSDFGPA